MGSLEPTPAAPRALNGDDAVRCPWCGSDEVEHMAEWGPQLLTEQYVCLSCRTPFEWIRKR